MGHQVLDENGEEKMEHKYVFAPDGKKIEIKNYLIVSVQLSF